MRSIIAAALFLGTLSGAAHEPEYSRFINDYSQAANDEATPALIEIESSTGRGDRLDIAALRPHELTVESIRAGNMQVASLDGDVDAAVAINAANAPSGMAGAVTDEDAEQSLADVCNALYTSAEDNDLPVAFFANLLWQESRLRDDAVSRKGALGIAQFMPETAAENGLANPFDPKQAIPASARFLRELRLQFGNLGFVAAAYNAGPRRVIEWLEHRSGLPRETRGYVERVTGLSVEAWRKIAVSDAALTFARPLPCRSLPAFASVEQEHSAQMQEERARLAQEEAQLDAAARAAARNATGKRGHAPARQDVRHVAAADKTVKRTAAKRPVAKREAAHRPRTGHDTKHKTV